MSWGPLRSLKRYAMLPYNETNWLLTLFLFRSCSVVTASVWATVDRALSLRSPNAIGAFWQWAGETSTLVHEQWRRAREECPEAM